MKTDRRLLAGRYLLETPVASGGMADVWRARDQVLDRPVAVKILHEGLAANEEVLERFRREAVLAAGLSHHAVVRIFDTGIDGTTCFIVMEMVEGPSLSTELGAPVPTAEAIRIARGTLEGLAHAHARGVVHRDVKPDNIVLQGRRVKVADFGIASAAFATGDISTTGDLIGNVGYLAPEQVDGGEADARSDLYAVGAVLYEMLTGRPPFEGGSSLATASLRLTQDPVPPGTLRGGVPRDLEAVVQRAMARDPGGRYESAAEMIAALDRCAAGRDPAPSPRDDAPETASSFRSWALVPLILVGLAAVAVVVGLLVGGIEIGNLTGGGDPDASIAPPPQQLAISGARSHDPEGDNGEEHEEDVASAIDGDTSTLWQTEGYTTADLGGIKDGVGLVLDLGEAATVAEVRIASPHPGWTFELRGSDDGASFSPALPDDGGETSVVAGERTTVRPEDASYRYLMIWITGLVQVDEYRAEVAEVEVFGG